MSRYPPQGTAVGPPPMPNKSSRSPERHRRPSPGYDRDAEWHRFQEWQKRNRKSPPRSSPPRSPPRRPLSPRKEDWSRRSPPRSFPPDWGRRSRSPPPGWARRSPPRYGPPRGRSPTRGRSPPRWVPPPPEWDRYRNYPPRRSPPRYGPPPPQWDPRRERYPPPPQERGRWPPVGPPTDKPSLTRPNGAASVPAPMNSEIRPSPEVGKMDDGSGEDDGLESYDVPEYDAEVPLGQKYVIAVSGFFCKICHKFYNSESSAKVTHCKSRTHYDKFAKWVNEKKEEAVAQKRSLPPEPVAAAVPTPVPAPVSTTSKQDDEPPPTKIPKVEPMEIEETPASEEQFETGLVVKEEVRDESDGEQPSKQYDPLEPTTEEPVVPKENKEDMNTSASETTSDAEKLTNDGDFTEATLYNFRKMRVQQLKENLKKRNLPIHGLKPLLLKRLEKALIAEAADAAAAESEEEESKEQQDETEESKPEGSVEVKVEEPQAEDADQESKTEGEPEPAEVTLTMHESDIEVSNKKTQWITERELERELLQLPNVGKISSMEKQETKMGKKTIAEWTIKLNYKGEFPSDGLAFSILSHQKLPFRASLYED